MEGRISDPFDFHLNNPGIREISSRFHVRGYPARVGEWRSG